MRRNGKNLNFELNIIPFIDLLSALICFLLLTAVWVQLKSVDSKQAVGNETIKRQQGEPASLMVDINAQGDYVFSLKNVRPLPTRFHNVVITQEQAQNTARLEQYLVGLKQEVPGVETAVIAPKNSSKYNDLVQLMAQMKKNDIKNVGIAPL
jgi:biopolymer transport protein TolR